MDIAALAKDFGFDMAAVIDAKPLEIWQRDLDRLAVKPAGAVRLESDLSKLGRSVLVVANHYVPFAEGAPVCAYYIAADRIYHMTKEFAEELKGMGIGAYVGKIPERAAAIVAGFGAPGLNGLLNTAQYGTRVALGNVILDAPFEGESAPRVASRCSNCRRCLRVCPVGAITMMGIDRARCLRAQMTGAVMSEQVKQNMPQLLGCELCQAACPANSQVGETETPQQVRGAFDLKRLLEGNTADALELVGKNLAGKLAAETLVMAGRSGDASFIPLIENWLGDEREGVADAAKWAIEQLG